jgi:hypothetical protein
MADNNSTQRAALARLAGNVMARTFTSALLIGTALTACNCWIAELDDSDVLMIAGRENVRAQAVGVLATDLAAFAPVGTWDSGTGVELDGDGDWLIRRWKVSPDAAVYTITLLTGE